VNGYWKKDSQGHYLQWMPGEKPKRKRVIDWKFLGAVALVILAGLVAGTLNTWAGL
jgi:hypothetical protein